MAIVHNACADEEHVPDLLAPARDGSTIRDALRSVLC
jgi:hypothetical protein